MLSCRLLFIRAQSLGAPKGGCFDQGLFSKVSSWGFDGFRGLRLEILEFTVGKEKKTINRKNLAGRLHFSIATIPSTCPVCPVELSRLSRGHSVQFIWNYTEIRSGRPGCPGDSPPTVPGTLPRHTDHQIPLCALFVYWFLLLPKSIKKWGCFQNLILWFLWFPWFSWLLTETNNPLSKQPPSSTPNLLLFWHISTSLFPERRNQTLLATLSTKPSGGSRVASS